MDVLHISVSAIRDHFYLTLFKNLNNLEIKQTIFTPYNTEEYSKDELLWAFSEYSNSQLSFVFRDIKKRKDRIFYHTKITKYMKSLIENININNIDIIHAHSLFSDGGVAYELWKKFKIPYIVAVRTTDLEYLKYFPTLSLYGNRIMTNASKIIFISPDLLENFKKKIKLDLLNSKKICIIPNGISDNWINYSSIEKNDIKKYIQLIQVSRLEKRKKVDVTIKTVKKLLDKGYSVKLILVGCGSQEIKLKKLVDRLNLNDYVFFKGYISNINEMKNLYRESDIFVMPSLGETFGITYIEALSQGLPIIGIKGTGISGYLMKTNVGFFAEKANPKYVLEKIEDVLTKNTEELKKECVLESQNFLWKNISHKYLEIYESII